MKVKSSSQIKLGFILNFINIGIGNIIPLVYTPLMLSLLGQSEYGLYKIASSTTSYLSLMAFGIGGAVSRYLIKARVEGGKEEEEKTFGLFYIVFQAIAIFTVVIGLIITLNLGLIYSNSLSSDELNRMKILVGIMVINTAVGFSATSYSSVVSTHEKFIFIQSVNILSTIGVPVFNIIVLYLGCSSIGMTVVSLAINVLTRIMYVIYVRKSLSIRPRFKNIPKNILKEIMVFSFWIFVSDIVGQLYNSTDMIIIGTIPALATIGAAVYSIGYTFPNIMFSLAQVMPSLFMPKVSKMVFEGASDEDLTDVMIRVGRMQCYIVSLICFGFIAFGQPFIHLYVGDDYKEAYWVAIIIMIPNCIPLVQSAAHSIIRAKNMHRFRSILYVIIAVLNVGGTLLLVRKFGIIGAAIPTGLCYIIGNGLIMNWYYSKRVHLNILRFWKNILPIYGVSTFLSVVALLVSKWINFYSWFSLLIGIIIFTFIFAITNWFFIMNNEEKNLIKEPVQNVIKKIKNS